VADSKSRHRAAELRIWTTCRSCNNYVPTYLHMTAVDFRRTRDEKDLGVVRSPEKIVCRSWQLLRDDGTFIEEHDGCGFTDSYDWEELRRGR
jgi:hemin uptake protein HemP